MSTSKSTSSAIVDALVAQQKEIYAGLAATESKEPSGKLPVLSEAKELMCSTFIGIGKDKFTDFFLLLHLLLLRGSPVTQQLVYEYTSAADREHVQSGARHMVYSLTIQSEDTVQRTAQWKSEKHEGTFRYNVALATYIIRIIGIRKIAHDAISSLAGPDSDSDSDSGSGASESFVIVKTPINMAKIKSDIEKIIKDCEPLEDTLRNYINITSDDDRRAYDNACLKLYKRIKAEFPSKADAKEFKNAGSVFEKAKKLREVWLSELNQLIGAFNLKLQAQE